MNKVFYLSDALLEDIVGGGELNDHELCLLLYSKGIDVVKKRSHTVKLNDLDKNAFYIVSNFVNLHHKIKQKLQDNCNYIIYEHDHKYITTRNPALYKDYLAPKNHIINIDFYRNAKAVFCQSSFHEKIIKSNLNLENLKNVSGNLWSMKSLEFIRRLSKGEKENKYSIMNSRITHKNTSETRFYCEKKGYDYQLISSKNYHDFLKMMSKNNKFIFLPKTPETLSRVVVEARMMGIKTITNNRVGASQEPWFNLKGDDLIDLMIKKREEIVNLILEEM